MNSKNLLPLLFLFISSIGYAQDGALDLSFGVDGKVRPLFIVNGEEAGAEALRVAIQDDGKIVVAGSMYSYSFAVARFHPNGDLDESFGVDGKTAIDIGQVFNSNLLEIQSDGKILIAAHTKISAPNVDFLLIRLNTDGSLDDSFGNSGSIRTDINQGKNDYSKVILIQEDGKILQAGSSPITNTLDHFFLVRYLDDGSLDPNFGVGGKVSTEIAKSPAYGTPRDLAIQTDQKILVAGYINRASPFDEEADITVIRYLPNGSLDLSFSDDGIFTIPNLNFSQTGEAISIQSDGKILIASRIYRPPGAGFSMIRLTEDGKLDNTFGENGMVLTKFGNKSFATSIHLQADQKILLAGGGSDQNDKQNFVLLRYLPDGSLDSTFGKDGKTETEFNGNSFANDITIQKDGKIVLAGSAFDNVNLRYNFAVSRYLTASSTNTQNSILQSEFAMTLFPNPIRATGILNYTLPHSAKVQINLYNQSGQWVQNILAPTTQVAGPQQQTVHFHKDLAPGVYHVVIDDQEQKYSIQVLRE